ncbi:beta strand repeat-containing protein [Solimicrobium silvestre]|uniref:Bacterial Ig-like domain (Group 1) n=1 Tax=Solimicrobium silvestre TaxID=2099400 RepID=A0A2S9H470_9BURK|nr:hypothetical protein [Solimicrobium silvestre]PRC94785.1 Bacterial Ig-like domain (group 1) [Solimicrobium silvestre]
MKLNLTPIFTARYWTFLMSALLLIMISACGGGNGSAGTPLGGSGSGSGGTGGTTPTTNGVITLTLTNAGTASNTIPSNGSLTATANVVNAAGAAVANTLVTFTLSGTTTAVIAPVLTALTNSSGNAVILLQAGTTAGAGTLTASATVVGTTAITGSASFQNLNGTTPGANSVITLALTTAAGTSATTIPPGGSLSATATVTTGGVAVPNALVTFSVSSATGSLPITTALTNSAGIAVVSLQSGTVSGAGTLTASTAVSGNTAPITNSVNYTSGATGPTASPQIAISFASSTGCTANTITTSCPITASATVTDASGNPVANTLVSFSNSLSGVVLAPSAGIVITNSSGVATVTVSAAGLVTSGQAGSAGRVSATTTIAGVTVVAGQNYTLGNTAITLVGVTPASGTANVSAYGTTTIAVQVDSAGAIYTAQPVTVNFASSCAANGKASLPATATTVNGVAQVTYTDNGCGTTDTVTASVAGVAATVTITLKVAAPTAASINFVAVSPTSSSIVLPSTGGVGRTSTATLTFEVVDVNGNPINGAAVNFANLYANANPGAPVIATLNSTSSTTGSNGQVTTTVTAVSVGTLSITASLVSTPSIASTSNTVVVSTGQPTQASFSLSASVFNIEGWSYNGITSTLTTFIADANGNPVVNGTPVVATTNKGSVGNSSGVSAGCTTVNGQCSLTFTSQNPRVVARTAVGVATVQFSSTNNTTLPIAGSLQLYLSGSSPNIYYFNGTNWVLANNNGGVPQALSTNNCSQNVEFVITDENGNPMPATTSIIATTTQTGITIGTLLPGAVPNTPVGGGTQLTLPTTPATTVNGTTVVIPYNLSVSATTGSAPQCLDGGGTQSPFNFSVTTTTPQGVTTLTNFVLKYPS